MQKHDVTANIGEERKCFIVCGAVTVQIFVTAPLHGAVHALLHKAFILFKFPIFAISAAVVHHRYGITPSCAMITAG